MAPSHVGHNCLNKPKIKAIEDDLITMLRIKSMGAAVSGFQVFKVVTFLIIGRTNPTPNLVPGELLYIRYDITITLLTTT